MDHAEITIIGAGVVGLAIAARLGQTGRQVIVLERHQRFGQETSSRSSEVIHSGIYYPPDTLKAALCGQGRDQLYAFCQTHGIAHRQVGKIIVAADKTEVAALEHLAQQGMRHGLPGLTWLSAAKVARLEPAVTAAAGLFVPSTGIIDSHAFMATLERHALAQGVIFSYGSPVTRVTPNTNGYCVQIRQDSETLQTRWVINCAGLASDQVAAWAGIDIDQAGYRLHWSKGDYFRSRRPVPVSRLIYPAPAEHTQTLGIHLTLDLQGGVRFGPDADVVHEASYTVDPDKRQVFAQAIQRYLPWIKPGDLDPDTAGIRPKLHRPGDGFRDFIIQEETSRGWPGLINCIGIESPGLTASLAIAGEVARLCGFNSARV